MLKNGINTKHNAKKIVITSPILDDNKYNMGVSIPLHDLLVSSVAELKVFGNDVYAITRELSQDIFYCQTMSSDLVYATKVNYSLSKILKKVDINSGRILGLDIPLNYYELSVYMLSHEYIHSLKELNYYEYINMCLVGEVVPIFYELIKSDNKLGKDLLKVRMINLLQVKNVFLDVTQLVDESNNFYSKYFGNNGLYKYYRGVCGVYLNSFYYAVMLYKMYKETPKKILDMVSKVLKHEMTTLELLEQLGIYGDIRGEIFEKELGMIKKRIK